MCFGRLRYPTRNPHRGAQSPRQLTGINGVPRPPPPSVPPSGAHSGSRAWLFSGTPCRKFLSRLVVRLAFVWGFLWVVIVLHGPFCECCIPFTLKQLRQNFVERGLDRNGQARTLRRRLAEQVKSESMERPEQQEVTQASDPTYLLRSAAASKTPNVRQVSEKCSEGGQASDLAELLRHVIPLTSEEPEEILRLFVRLGEVYDLGLAADRSSRVSYPLSRGV